jgi:hypothetical protein
MTQDTERIRVGEEADGGESVELPVIDVLAGRGFITGKSGSGKSNTASVVAEQLLEAGYGLLIVDVDGEYYGLKEEYELLHAGADEECDIRVSPEHAGKLASLALEENVPIILDVSSYLDPEDADEMLLAVARQLFAKAKKQKKPFLVLVEECHEYIPEGGGMTETGKMLIKIGKRGRKHGLGIVGMSQRPADVKKDFITQCDWMVWHRLTWDNDTRVVGRILGSEYADRVEELGDGEAFLDSDWTDDLRRVQFDRKRTFDAGATPGLEEFERPDLQSVSAELVADLQQVSEERERHESELQSLEAELAEKEQRIEKLEAELAEARDMSEMADRFAQALVENADAAPPARSPAEAEVEEAEEFVSAATHAEAPETGPDDDLETTEPADRASETADSTAERELLPEEQRDLHAYAVSDGGTHEEDDAEETPEAAETTDDDAPANEPDDSDTDTDEPSGLQPVRTISSRTEPASAVDDSEQDDDEGGSAAEQAAEAQGSAADDTPADEDRSGTEAELTADRAGPNGTETDRDASEAPHEQHPAESTSGPDDSQTEDAVEVTVEHAGPAADDSESSDEELVAEPGTWSEHPESGAESEPDDENDAQDEPLEATGDWPTPDGERTAHEAAAGSPEPPTDPERTAALEQKLAEEFGVTMERGSNLTGGSLGSSAPDRASRSEPAAEPPTENDSGDEANEGQTAGEKAATADCTERDRSETDGSPVDPTADRGERLTELVEESELRNEEGVVQVFVHGIDAFDDVTRGMLKHYRNDGKATPVDAHVAAGGSGERQYAYARNRTLRTAGVVEHAGGGRYRYRLPDLVLEVFDGNVEAETLSETVTAIEEAVGLTE